MSRKNLFKIYIYFKFFFDLGLSLAAFFLAYYIRFYNKIFINFFPPNKGIPRFEKYYDFLPFFIAICIFTYSAMGRYKKQFLDFFDEIFLSFKTTVILWCLLFAVSFFYRSYEYSRLFLSLVVILIFIFIPINSYLLNYFYRSYSKYIFGKPRIGFLCTKEKMDKIKKYLKNDKSIKKFFLNEIKSKKEILDFLFSKKIDELVIDYEIFNSTLFQNLLFDLISLDISLKVLISLPVRLSNVMIDYTLGIPFVYLKPLSFLGINFFIKRTLDILFSILLFSILFIPLVFISIIIKLDSEGPIFFIHERVGYKGRKFKCVKFRTMYKDAHTKWWKLLKYSIRGEKVLKLKDDPRITKIGKLLRKFSIDEIPQFFNVLKGEMSIVGPRPQIVEEASFYDNYSKRRLMVLPGITGLWQISGRGDLDFEQMLNLDLYYVENWSLGLDLKIIYKTFGAIFSKRGAY